MVTACQEEIDNIDNVKSIESAKFENDKAIIAKLGFDTLNIKEYEDSYVVEGDIELYKKYLTEYGKGLEDIDDSRVLTKQSMTNVLVSQANIQNIHIAFPYSSYPSYSDTQWREAFDQAVNHWNNLSETSVRFFNDGYSASQSNIVISYVNLGGADANGDITVAQAGFPKSGSPHNSILINNNTEVDFILKPSMSQKVWTLVHEIGHCIGLRHTNWRGNGESVGSEGAVDIPNTPTSGNNPDPQSVMTTTSPAPSWNGFSNYDKIAIKYMYPFNLEIKPTIKSSCIGNNISYTLTGIYINSASTVKWEVVSNNATLVSGQGTSTPIFNATSTGKVTVRAIVSFGHKGEYTIANSDVWIGAPSIPEITNLSGGKNLQANTTYRIWVDSNGADSYSWNIMGNADFTSYSGTTVTTHLNYIDITTGDSNTEPGMIDIIRIRCTTSNSCGTKEGSTQFTMR